MHAPDSPRKRFASIVRVSIVVLLGALVIAGTLPGLSFIWDSHDVSWGPHGSLGFSTDYDGKVKAVQPRSPASSAGILPGDRVDLARTAPDDRYYLAGSPARIPAGERVTFNLIAPGGQRQITLTAPREPFPLVSRFDLLARTLASFVFVIVGGMLVLLRPSIMTWGFYLYCLGFSPGIAFASLSRYPSFDAHAVNVLAGDILTAAATVGIFVFALFFMRDNPSTWRRFAERLVPYLFLMFAILICYPDVANLFLGMRAERVQEVMLALQGAMLGLSIVITLDTYIRARAGDRERIRFVVLGLIVGILGTYSGVLLLFSSVLPFAPPQWIGGLLLLLNITLPVTVAYAVIRHRVLDLSFVVSRAIIYGILTFVLGSVFALISWFIGHELEATNLARILEIGAAIGLSFWLNDLQAKVSGLIDRIFFRQRRAAMLRLSRLAEAMPHAQQRETVDKFLIDEPVSALDLSSAALFRREEHGGYQESRTIGWPEQPVMLAHEDPLVLNLEAQQEPIRPSEIAWEHPFIEGIACPVLAVPLLVRRTLVGIALYGAHKNGADIDPDEARALQQLAISAEASYDHLRAEALDEEVAKLKSQAAESERLKAELATLQQALNGQQNVTPQRAAEASASQPPARFT